MFTQNFILFHVFWHLILLLKLYKIYYLSNLKKIRMRLETSNPILRILTNTVLLERKNKRSNNDTLLLTKVQIWFKFHKNFC